MHEILTNNATDLFIDGLSNVICQDKIMGELSPLTRIHIELDVKATADLKNLQFSLDLKFRSYPSSQAGLDK